METIEDVEGEDGAHSASTATRSLNGRELVRQIPQLSPESVSFVAIERRWMAYRARAPAAFPRLAETLKTAVRCGSG